jgi:hypothetical protein
MNQQDSWERIWSAVGVRLARTGGSAASDRGDLGVELPPRVFSSSESFNEERIGALAMYCSDRRWGEAFDEFCHRVLLLPRYDRFAVPGGPMCLVDGEGRDPGLKAAVRKQLELLVKVHGLGRIVLMAHYGCAAYTEGRRKAEDVLETQISDIRSATGVAREWFPGLRVDGFLAMRKGPEMGFHEVKA